MAGKSNQQPGNANPGLTLKPEERHRMVAEAAYYKAEKRGFLGGDPEADWVEAEAEVESSLDEPKQTRTRVAETRSRSPRSTSP